MGNFIVYQFIFNKRNLTFLFPCKETCVRSIKFTLDDMFVDKVKKISSK